MKERIVITQDWLVKDMKAGVPELDKLFICQKVEKTPESFDEIKQLLHDNKDVFNKSVKKIEISEFMIEIHFKLQTICFLHNGDIVEPNCLRPIVTRRTPEQMWQIIKNLIGAE